VSPQALGVNWSGANLPRMKIKQDSPSVTICDIKKEGFLPTPASYDPKRSPDVLLTVFVSSPKPRS